MVRSLFAVTVLAAVSVAYGQSSWKPGGNSVGQKKETKSSTSQTSNRSNDNRSGTTPSKPTWKPGGNAIGGGNSTDRNRSQGSSGSWRPGSGAGNSGPSRPGPTRPGPGVGGGTSSTDRKPTNGGFNPTRPGPGVGGSGQSNDFRPGGNGTTPVRPGPGTNTGGSNFGFQGPGWNPGGSQGGRDRNGANDGWKSNGGRPGFSSQAGINLFDNSRPRNKATESNNVFFGDKNTDFARSPNNQSFASLPGQILSPGIIRPNDQGWRDAGWRPASPPRNELLWNGYRCGYHHYRPNWHNGYFHYSSYTYYPVASYVIVPSPWYYYFSLPPYLNGANVIYGQPWRTGFSGNPYFWGNSRDLDRTVEDIIEVFRSGDSRIGGYLVPRRGQVAILMDDRYLYSLEAESFLDLYLDGVTNNRTTSYWVENVWENGNEAKVVARHEYMDPWGRLQRTYHTYYLERERGEFVIRAFGVSR